VICSLFRACPLRYRFGVGLYATSPHSLALIAGFPLLSLTQGKKPVEQQKTKYQSKLS